MARTRLHHCKAGATLIALTVLLQSSNTLAAMDDPFLRAEPIGPASSGFLGEASYDARDSNPANYRGGHLKLGYKLSPDWSLEATYWRRNLTYSAEKTDVDSWQVAAYYGLLSTPEDGRKLTLKLSVWGDYADQLAKRSSTSIAGNAFSNIRVAHPSDTQVQADLIYTGHPWQDHFLTGFLSAGYSWVNTGDLQASLRQGNCLFNVRIGADNIAKANLAQPCTIGRARITNASFSADAAQYGVQTGKDFNYGAAFVGIGGSWRWQFRDLGVIAAYHFQYLFRDLNDRLAAYGSSNVQLNQTLAVELSYAPFRHVEFFLRAQGFQNSFIGYVPALYNAATANSLNRKYGLGSVGVRIHGF